MDSRPKGGGPHRQGYIRFATQPTSPTHQRCLRLYHRAVGLWSTHWYLSTTSLGDVAFVYNIVLIWWFPVRGPTRVTKANQLSLDNQRLSKPPLQADVNPLSGGSLTLRALQPVVRGVHPILGTSVRPPTQRVRIFSFIIRTPGSVLIAPQRPPGEFGIQRASNFRILTQ